MSDVPPVVPSIYMSCRDLLHPKTKSCNEHFIKTVIGVYGQGIKLFLPFYVVTAITRRRPLNLTTLKNIIKQVLRGSLSFAASGPVTLLLCCYSRNLLGYHSRVAYFISTFISTYLGISLETRSRHKELTIFTLGLCGETLFRMLVSRGIIRNVPFGIPLAFVISITILVYFFNHNRDCLGNSKSILEQVCGNKNEEQVFITKKIDVKILKLLKLSNEYLKGNISYVLNGILKGVGIGLFFKLLSSIMGLLSKKKSSKATSLFEKLRFPSFLVALFGGYRLTLTLLEYIFGRESDIPKIIASIVAGTSALISPSLELTVYICAKAVEAVWNYLVKYEYVKPIPGSEKVLFASSCALVFYSSVFENHNVRPSYWKWLVRQSNYSLTQVKKISPYLAKELGIPHIK